MGFSCCVVTVLVRKFYLWYLLLLVSERCYPLKQSSGVFCLFKYLYCFGVGGFINFNFLLQKIFENLIFLCLEIFGCKAKRLHIYSDISPGPLD